MIEPVRFSEWAAPVVPVVKSDGFIRICGDYKQTTNSVARADAYPLPRVEDILASLAGGKSFSKLDLAHAYQQLVLDEESKKYTTTINTDKGLYQYNRLTFGVPAAPAIFQRTMENILQGLLKVCVYIDDILVTGQTEAEYLQNLHKVLTRIEEAGMHLKRAKCKFLMESVEFLGHVISAEGVLPNKKKVEAVRHSPPPSTLHQWEWPRKPWSRIHIDYAGPFMGKMFLIAVDAHSKWMEVVIVNSATSTVTIEKLRAMFASHGLPETLVADNGSVFVSVEFHEFLRRNGIKHIRTAPYHPASNGQAKRAVQTFKNGMKRSTKDT